MGVYADGRDAREREVEGHGLETGAGEEGDHEGAETTVDVERDLVALGEGAEGGDVVDDAVGEVGR